MSLALSPRRAILMPGPWVQDELWRRARAVPSLDLRFADSKSLIDVVSGLSLITYTRASSGTYVGSDGLIKTATTNEPRFDHNPTTGESLGLLVEEQRANLLLHSRTLTDAAWVATNITPAKNETGADGVGNSASSITATAANGTILQTVTSASAARATSAYVRRITGSGAIEMTQNGGTTWTAITVTSAWTRVTIPSATVTNPVVGFRIATSGNAIAVDYVQCETGAFVTSAIETTTAAVTRNADVASITGANFSSWYRQDAFGAFAQFTRTTTATGAPFSLNDGSATNRISALITSSAFTAARNTAGAGVLFTPATSNAPNSGLNKMAQASTNVDHAIVANAGTVATASTYNMPVVDRFEIGSQLSGSYLNGALARLTIWPQRLPNSTLQAITQ